MQGGFYFRFRHVAVSGISEKQAFNERGVMRHG